MCRTPRLQTAPCRCCCRRTNFYKIQPRSQTTDQMQQTEFFPQYTFVWHSHSNQRGSSTDTVVLILARNGVVKKAVKHEFEEQKTQSHDRAQSGPSFRSRVNYKRRQGITGQQGRLNNTLVSPTDTPTPKLVHITQQRRAENS